MKKKTLEEFQQIINEAHPKEKLLALNYANRLEDAQVKCLTCGEIYTKKACNFMDARKVSICKNCFPTQANTKKADFQPPEGYQLVGNYTGMHNKVLTKCLTCGFIWEIQPSNLKQGKGCPKCNKQISKGEKKISAWLKNNNILYIAQLPIKIKEHTFFIDFYLPDYDLYIEYQGEQHFHPIKFFGGEEKFEYQQKNDNLKRDFLKNKLLEISYLDFDNVEEILKSSTTSSKERTL